MQDNNYFNDQFNAQFLEQHMESKCFGKKVFYYEEIDSTNTMAKKLGKQQNTHGNLVLAEQQSTGRGRLGRTWSSPKGSGIWMSLILQPKIQSWHASMLTLVAALAVNKSIREVTGLNSLIKWPNDIVMNGKKVCGILTEMNTCNEKLQCVVIGIGINTNQEGFSPDIQDKATSLRLESGIEIDRTNLIVNIMKYLEQYFEVFMRSESLKELMNEYNQMLVNINRQVRIIEPGSEYNGFAAGIDETGALLVKTEEVEEGIVVEITKAVVSGEVSVRGIYGYV